MAKLSKAKKPRNFRTRRVQESSGPSSLFSNDNSFGLLSGTNTSVIECSLLIAGKSQTTSDPITRQ